jgi:hypothetical protein
MIFEEAGQDVALDLIDLKMWLWKRAAGYVWMRLIGYLT